MALITNTALLLILLVTVSYGIRTGSKVDGIASAELRTEDPKFVREFDRPRYVPYAHSLKMTANEEHGQQSELVEKGLVDRAGAFDDFDHFDFEKEFSDSQEAPNEKSSPSF